MNHFSLEYMLHIFPTILSGIYVTLYMSIVSFIIGLCLSIALSMLRYYKIPLFSQLSGIYISFFRAVPVLALLFFIFLVIPRVFPIFRGFSPESYTIASLSLFVAAYMAENFRAAFDAIDKGQFEACISLGMNRFQSMHRIIFPQAFKIALPSLGNNFIMLIKAAALGFTVGVPDILAIAKTEAAVSFRFFEAYLAVMLIYWGVVIIFEQLLKVLERKISNIY